MFSIKLLTTLNVYSFDSFLYKLFSMRFMPIRRCNVFSLSPSSQTSAIGKKLNHLNVSTYYLFVGFLLLVFVYVCVCVDVHVYITMKTDSVRRFLSARQFFSSFSFHTIKSLLNIFTSCIIVLFISLSSYKYIYIHLQF